MPLNAPAGLWRDERREVDQSALAALTIARMPALRAAGRDGQDSMRAASSGAIWTELAETASGFARSIESLPIRFLSYSREAFCGGFSVQRNLLAIRRYCATMRHANFHCRGQFPLFHPAHRNRHLDRNAPRPIVACLSSRSGVRAGRLILLEMPFVGIVMGLVSGSVAALIVRLRVPGRQQGP
jgi:hypothetical protein